MATNLISNRSFTGIEPPILAVSEQACAFRGLTIDLSTLQTDADGNKMLPAGSILTRMSSGLGRALPIGLTTATATASSSTTLTVGNASIFRANDPLVVMRPYATVTLAGTWAVSDTVTITLDGTAVTGTSATATAAGSASDVAVAFNADPLFASKAVALVSGAVIYVYSKTGVAYSIAAAKTGSGTATASGSVLLSNVSIGAVHATTAINTTTNVITLAAAAAVSLPVGMPIGVYVAPASIYGLTIQRILLASTAAEVSPRSNDVAAYYDATVYQARLPYWDAALGAALPEISLV